jgi:hypothetical protein
MQAACLAPATTDEPVCASRHRQPPPTSAARPAARPRRLQAKLRLAQVSKERSVQLQERQQLAQADKQYHAAYHQVGPVLPQAASSWTRIIRR